MQAPQLDSLAADLLEKLVRNGLVAEFDRSPRGIEIGWTPHGAMAAIGFKTLALQLKLIEADERPLLLDALAHGHTADPSRRADTLNAALQHYITCGFAKHINFTFGVGLEVTWTELGQTALKSFAAVTDALGIAGDEDHLILFFVIMQTCAPDSKTPILLRPRHRKRGK